MIAFERGAESLTAFRRALAAADRPLPSSWAGKASTMAGGLARQVIRRTTPLSGRAGKGPARELAAEAAHTLSVLGELACHRQEQDTLLLSVVRHLDAAERVGGPVERAEAYANFAVVAALAGSEPVARHYGRLPDEEIDKAPDPVAVSRARLARGLRLIAEGRFTVAQRVLTLARRSPSRGALPRAPRRAGDPARARLHLLGDDAPAARAALDDALRTVDRPDMPLRPSRRGRGWPRCPGRWSPRPTAPPAPPPAAQSMAAVRSAHRSPGVSRGRPRRQSGRT
ncbi:hypothetical protein ABZ860_22825 [Microbispora sp. NPDC046973]|uniref:hypothetical protein n=1 Tax=Microbispora sp. NPDC046973 TaxID=3155022 RepID=UPI0033DCEF9F